MEQTIILKSQRWWRLTERKEKLKREKGNTSTIKENNSGAIRAKLEGLITLKDITPMRAFLGINKGPHYVPSIVWKAKVSYGTITLPSQLVWWQNRDAVLLNHKATLNQAHKEEQGKERNHAAGSHGEVIGFVCWQTETEKRVIRCTETL